MALLAEMVLKWGYKVGWMVLCMSYGIVFDCSVWWLGGGEGVVFLGFIAMDDSWLCGSINVPEMYELLSGSLGVFVGDVVKGDGMSVLIGCMCCLVHLYFLLCTSI